MTLIELMVSLLLASLISLAVMGALGTAASSRQSTHAVNDINQSGAYSLLVLDKWLRSAGSGFSQASDSVFGCRLHVSKANTQILPRLSGSPLPAPFASVTTGTTGLFRLAPAIIAAGQTTPGDSGSTSDVLIVMSGHSGDAESAMEFTALSATTTLTVNSTLGVAADDLVLVADTQRTAGGVKPCMVSQVASSWLASNTTVLSLSGTYYASTIDTANLTDYSIKGLAFNMGTVANPPRFALLGVGDASTLYSYDLLQTDSSPLQPIAANVFELHALYGVDTDNNGSVDTWFKPTASGYTAAALMDGSAASATRLKQIRAIRVGLLLRTTVTDSSQTAPASLTLFSDLGSDLTFTRSLTTAERKYRYRATEATVPLRNPML